MRNFRGVDIVQIPSSFYLLIVIGLAWGITTLIAGPNKDEMTATLAPDRQTTLIVICVKDIPKDSRIDSTMIITSLPAKSRNDLSAKAISRESEAIGRIAARDLKRGQELGENDLK